MSAPPLPPDEDQRLRALRDYEVLDSPPEAAFERITALAARLLGVPVALVSLVDAKRQWSKSAHGLEVRELPREVSFCAHAILSDDLLIVPDATRDPRFAENPLVTGPPGMRFYAGAPLLTPGGQHRIGTLCIIDFHPRGLDQAGQQTLRDLAAVVVDGLELRRETRRRERAEVLRETNAQLELRVAERTASLGCAVEELSAAVAENGRLAVAVNSVSLGVTIVDATAPDYPIIFANPAFEAMTGYPRPEVLGRNCRFLQGPESDPETVDRMRAAVHAWQPFQGTLLNYRRDGTPFWSELTISPVGQGPGGARHFIGIMADVTARRQAEERLRLLESAVVNAHDAVLITEAEPMAEPGPRILYANAAFERMTGYVEGEILGQTPRILQGPNTSEAAKANIRRALDAKRPVREGLVNYRKDGSEFWVELNIVPVANERGWFTHWVSVQRDVTEQKAAERALRHSEEQYRQLFDVNPLPTWVYDRETLRFLEVNPAAVAHYGYTRAEFLDGMTLRDLRAPEEVPALETFLEALGPGPADGPRTWRHRLKGGREILVEIVSDDLTFAGRGARLVVVHDVTEQRRTERALRESQGHYERMTANVPGMVYQFIRRADGTSYFPFVRQACREIYGVEPEDILRDGRVILDLVTPEGRADFIASIVESAATLQPWRWEGIVRVGPDHQVKHLQATSRPERLDNGDTVWDGVVLDVTERVHHEGLQRAKEEAERANLAKSEFLSRMSHELRTPLNAILGFGQLLELEPLTPHQFQSVEHILRGGRHLLGLIDEVLNIARIESGHLTLFPEPVDLGTLLRETLGLVRPLAVERGVRLREVAAADPGVVRADPSRLKQILLNLLSNAVKYNRPGGEVELGCRAAPPGPGSPDAAGRVRVTVRDTGEGIAPEGVARLFIPFERLGAAHGRIEGTGLGLAVSKRLAEAMGATLGVESTPGVGSTFWVELPRAPDPADPAAPAHPAAAPVPAPAPTGRRLLYIEDNVSNFHLVRVILAQHRPDWQLLAAPDGPRGLALVRAEPPDLVLLDLQLPGMTGDTVLAELRADPRTRGVPVVLLSADANPQSRARLLAAGARAYLTKPLDVREFLAAADVALRAE